LIATNQVPGRTWRDVRDLETRFFRAEWSAKTRLFTTRIQSRSSEADGSVDVVAHNGIEQKSI
jgi:hypothetical protein